jgi:hypothetical protein
MDNRNPTIKDMRTFKIHDYNLPALTVYNLDGTHHPHAVPAWEKILIGKRKQIPAYFYPSDNPASVYPFPSIDEPYTGEIIVQYREEYNGFIMTVTKH